MKQPMKISLAISVLILVLAAFFGLQKQNELAAATKEHRTLVEEAATLGLTIGADGSELEVLVTKRAREDKEAEARLAAKDFIGFALEMEAFKENGQQPDEATQERISGFTERMLSLDAEQLKILIEEFRASSEMEEETRTGLISFAIMTMASNHPEAALTLLTESEDLMENGMMGKHHLSSSLANWARQDPEAALEWVRKEGEKHPDLITDEVKAGLVKGAAINGMILGFDLLEELKMEDPGDAIRGLARAVNSPEERTEFLELFREYSKSASKSDGNDVSNMIRNLADGIAKDGFEAGSKWISENNLSPKEIDSLSGSLTHYVKSEEQGLWIEWMGENLSEKQRDRMISNTMRNWTTSDYRAAGEWLASAPEGATKNSAIKSYSKTVARYDSATAAQWALTLSNGKERADTLRDIHSNMPRETPDEKAAHEDFKEEYGIE